QFASSGKAARARTNIPKPSLHILHDFRYNSYNLPAESSEGQGLSRVALGCRFARFIQRTIAMSFYAYCLLRPSSDEPWPVMSCISDHPVFPLRCGKYTMLLSRLGRDFAFSPRSIVEHGQVISHAFETHTVLPMRFATFFQSERQIDNLIRENQK